MAFDKFVNTQYFREAALSFKKNGGFYTRAPRGSKDYIEFWDEEEGRCKNGYKVGDLWIPGRHYFALNYCPMMKVPNEVLFYKDGSPRRDFKGTVEKVLELPNFWEVDYEWWNYKHIARRGGTFNGITSPGGEHMVCVKVRQAGFSYKEAVDGVYNYTFIPRSKSYYFASKDEYLTKDGILNKAHGYMSWINDHTPWKKNRQKLSRLMHSRASYLDAEGVEKGYMSEIIGIIVDDPNKVRGKSGMKITFEESGSFKRLKEALAIALPSVREGGRSTGQITVFGTGGEEGEAIDDFIDLFECPEAHGFLAFPNVYDDDMEGTNCGYFVPCYKANSMFTDVHGNIDIIGALEYEDKERALKAKSRDPKDLDRRKAEFPKTPKEALQRVSKNKFPLALIDAQIAYIKSNKILQALLRTGDLIRMPEGGIEFVPTPKHAPVEQYPHRANWDLHGCITIAEPPVKLEDGKTPNGMYSVVVDPYYKDDSQSLTSLYSVRVFKLENPYDNKYCNLPVAWFTGRPLQLDTAHEIALLLTEYYNATMQSEIAGGGVDLFNYVKKKHKLHLLEKEPELTYTKEFGRPPKNQSYFMNMSTETKEAGITYVIQWMLKPRGLDEDGNEILNIHQCFDLGFLQECRRWNDKGNFDRLSSYIVGMFMLKECQFRTIDYSTSQNAFYNRVLFGGTSDDSEQDALPAGDDYTSSW